MLKVDQVIQEFKLGFMRKRTQILKGVSFDIPQGSVFGFLGPNGAGKTTLIRLIVGTREPTSGSILLKGEHTSTLSAKKRIGYLPERPYFYPHLTGRGFLKHYAILSEVPYETIDSKIVKTLEIVGLSGAIDKELRHYSKGMLQRVGIAQSILHDPEFIVLDEPMSGLDPNGRREIRELIKKLSTDGRTVFFSTHVVTDVEAICDRVAIINHGRITHLGKIQDLIDPKTKWIDLEFSFSDPTLKASVESDFGEKIHDSDGRWIVRTLIDSEWNSKVQKWIAKGVKLHAAVPYRPSLEELI